MYLASMVRELGLAAHQLHFDMGMIGIKTFSPRSMSELLAVLHIRTGGDSPASIKDILKANPALGGIVKILGGSGAFAGKKPEGVDPSPYKGGVELNNLKQFRDCYDMGAAIYRGIVASKATHTKVDNIVVFDPSHIEIAFMWSDSIAQLLTELFDAERPTHNGPPAEHFAAAQRTRRLQAKYPNGVPAPPDTFQLPLPTMPNDMDWDMNRVVLKAEFGFSFSSNVHFEVLSTIHTYGLTTA
jgi:hypothetical protein